MTLYPDPAWEKTREKRVWESTKFPGLRAHDLHGLEQGVGGWRTPLSTLDLTPVLGSLRYKARPTGAAPRAFPQPSPTDSLTTVRPKGLASDSRVQTGLLPRCFLVPREYLGKPGVGRKGLLLFCKQIKCRIGNEAP